jgi:hypothetical protein
LKFRQHLQLYVFDALVVFAFLIDHVHMVTEHKELAEVLVEIAGDEVKIAVA